MESLFENKTKYSKELYDKYIEFHAKKYGVKEIIEFIIVVISALILIVIDIQNIEKLKFAFIGIIVILASIIYVFIRERVKAKKQYEGMINKKQKDSYAEYSFFDQYFISSYQGESRKVYYVEIKKVFILKDRYYLYLDKNHACVLLKDGFTKGTEEDFRKFLDTKGFFRMKQVKEKQVKEVEE